MPQIEDETIRHIRDELTHIGERLSRIEENLLLLAGRLAENLHAGSAAPPAAGAPSEGQFQDTLTRLLLGQEEGR